MNEDTLHLLSECAAGTDMAVRSLDDVIRDASNGPLKNRLLDSRKQHAALAEQTKQLLAHAGKEPKRAEPAARAMSYLKTNMKIALRPGDATIASLISEGCSMGIESLARYCNQYPAASDEARQIARTLIRLEDRLVQDMRPYL